MRKKLTESLKRVFRPEFINRLDSVIVFRSLNKDDIKQIVDIQLRYLQPRLDEHQLTLEVTDEVKNKFSEDGFDRNLGARPLKRAIQQQIENPVARLILEGKFGPRTVVPVDWQDGQFVFTRTLQ
jgi:ATP-dependent Clp protease ATP-binding subunit ClpB